MMVTQQQKKEWGSYPDRKDSYDDKKDIQAFIRMVEDDDWLQSILSARLKSPINHFRWIDHPDGLHGADFGLQNRETNEIGMTFDVERWFAWKADWPSYYHYIHFLGRKDHLLEVKHPFMMVYLNYHQDQCCMVDKEIIASYPTKDKYFSYKQCWDRVKEVPLYQGLFHKRAQEEIEA